MVLCCVRDIWLLVVVVGVVVGVAAVRSDGCDAMRYDATRFLSTYYRWSSGGGVGVDGKAAEREY